MIADLSFADLLLLVQDGDGKYVVAEQCRPSTVMTLRAEDVVGNVMPDDMVGELTPPCSPAWCSAPRY